MHKYRLVSKKGEGTFSEVLKAQSIKTGKYVAIKCMKNHFNTIEQVNNLREIQALRKLSPFGNIVKLQEVLYDEPTGRLALVFELMDMNLYELYESMKQKKQQLNEQKVKYYMYQVIKSVEHMHSNGIFHRDIKPENILITDDTVKLADFGSCRGISQKQPFTEYISTRWYRAPECLLTDGYYNYKMDIWGVGCVFFEILSYIPLFPGNNELDQINKIHNILGTPSAELFEKYKPYASHMDLNFPQKQGVGFHQLLQNVSPQCLELLDKMLAYNPDDRFTAKQAMKHPYFKDLREQDRKYDKIMNSPQYLLRGTMYSKLNGAEHFNSNESSLINHNDHSTLNTININSKNNQMINVNINLIGQKQNNKMFPEIRQNNMITDKNKHLNSEDSDFEILPPLKNNLNDTIHSKKNLQNTKKQSKINYLTNQDQNVSSHSNINNKKVNNKKRSYVSPYSQKFMAHKFNM